MIVISDLIVYYHFPFCGIECGMRVFLSTCSISSISFIILWTMSLYFTLSWQQKGEPFEYWKYLFLSKAFAISTRCKLQVKSYCHICYVTGRTYFCVIFIEDTYLDSLISNMLTLWLATSSLLHDITFG